LLGKRKESVQANNQITNQTDSSFRSPTPLLPQDSPEKQPKKAPRGFVNFKPLNIPRKTITDSQKS
jgi:hypothetical protein